MKRFLKLPKVPCQESKIMEYLLKESKAEMGRSHPLVKRMIEVETADHLSMKQVDSVRAQVIVNGYPEYSLMLLIGLHRKVPGFPDLSNKVPYNNKFVNFAADLRKMIEHELRIRKQICKRNSGVAHLPHELRLFESKKIKLGLSDLDFITAQAHNERMMAPRGSRPEHATRVYVGNLPWSVNNRRLEQVFSEHGKVVDARVIYDRDTGLPRGFGFVTMSNETELKDAIAALDGQNMESRKLRVAVAWR